MKATNLPKVPQISSAGRARLADAVRKQLADHNLSEVEAREALKPLLDELNVPDEMRAQLINGMVAGIDAAASIDSEAFLALVGGKAPLEFGQPTAKVPTAWIVKINGEYQRVTTPPELGTPVFHGRFQQNVIDGGYDARGEKNLDRVQWLPSESVPVTETPYGGEGDPNMVKFDDPDDAQTTRFMVKREGQFLEITERPAIGTELFVGTFQKRMVEGKSYQQDDGPPPMLTKWLPGSDVRSVKYGGSTADTEQF